MKFSIGSGKRKGKTVVMVTHDLQLAKYASRHIHLKDGEMVEDKANPEQIDPDFTSDSAPDFKSKNELEEIKACE